MEKKETNLRDCYVIKANRFGDNRGYFESLTIEDLNSLGFKNIEQISRSKSGKGILRGMHFQKGKYAQAKVVSCINGAVLDVVVDLRTDSPTYGQYTSVELTPENGKMLYVPRGFAHGFLSLEEDTIFQYFVDNKYMPTEEGGLIYNDSDIGINWQFEKYGIEAPICSEKDTKYPTLKKLPDYFKGV